MLSISFSFPSLFGGRAKSSIDIEHVEVHNIDTGRDKLARTIKHLIKLNHAKHAILFHDMQFHNHAPHVCAIHCTLHSSNGTNTRLQILGSAYLLKGTPAHLDDIYEEESKSLAPWTDSPNEVSSYDWRDYLGDRRYHLRIGELNSLIADASSRYQRAYVDFFEDELVLNGYDWKKVLNKYLFEGKEPLFNCLIAGREYSSLNRRS